MALEGNLVVIGDPTNINSRALIAKKLAKQGFSNIEPIEYKTILPRRPSLQASRGREAV